MNDYRLYRLGGVGGLAPVDLLTAQDDEDAVRQARELGRNAIMCELWQGKRLVMALDRQDLTE